MTHMKNICQKLAVAAASGASGFAALETLPESSFVRTGRFHYLTIH
jgi:hypothetical protein